MKETGVVAVKESEMVAWFAEVGRAITSLQQEIEAMDMALVPVLRQAEPMPCTDGIAEEELCQHATTLRCLWGQIETCTDTLASIRRRLEV